ncbi:hypothetical protein AB0G15_23295 [Streptosporangium sp. NPDC023825]|uniref:hypothetical protein n=1 Tax=Streptosporangium sp. NPDC023825 TaxID=3154909 RepID=UPI003430DF3F
MVVVHAPLAVVAERFSGPGWVLEELDGRGCLLRTGGDSLERPALTAGQLGLDLTVGEPPEPPEPIDHARTLAARLQASTEPPLRQ